MPPRSVYLVNKVGLKVPPIDAPFVVRIHILNKMEHRLYAKLAHQENIHFQDLRELILVKL